MREIKFRAWDIDGKQMIPWCDLKYDVTFEEVFDNEFLEVNQYTGLKDKNGVEIYEGDIVDFWGRKFLVVYNLGGFGCFGLNDAWHPLGDTIYRPTTVIGNRYENPELLQ